MKVMALDTTTPAGSVALVDDGRVIEERAGDPSRSTAERLPADLVALAEAHALTLADVDLFGVAIGPGSFTGLRVGIATIQGLAAVGGSRVVGVSALDALAHAIGGALAPGTSVAAWMDAHRGEVFAAAYRVTHAAESVLERIEMLEGPTVGSPSAILDRWAESRVLPDVVVGDGAMLYAHVARSGNSAARIAAPPLLAGTIGRLAAVRAKDAVEPGRLRPLYVRRPDAEIARDARR